MPTVETVTLKLIAQDLASGNISKAITGIDKMAQRGGIMGSVFQGVGLSMGMMLNPLNLMTRGFGALKDAYGEALDAGRAEEANIRKLDAALEANVEGWNGNTAAIEAYFSKTQDLVAFADTDLRNSMGALIAVTKNVKEAIDVQAIAMDLARFKAIDLKTATDLLVRVFAGNFGTLSRYGIIVDRNATKTEALAAIQKQAAGQARTYGNTSLAAAQKAEMAWGDVREAIGMMLSESAEGLDELSLQVANFVKEKLPGSGAEAFDRAMDELLAGAKGVDLAEAFFSDVGKVIDDILNPKIIEDFSKELGADFDEIRLAAGLTVANIESGYKRAKKAAEEWGASSEEAHGIAILQVGAVVSELYQAAQAGLDAGEKLEDGLKRPGPAAEALADAIDHVAETSFPDLKDAAKDAQKAIRAAFKDQHKPIAQLRREEERLQQQRRRAMRENRFDIVATIDARLAEVNQQINHRKVTNQHYRKERAEQKQRRHDLNLLQRKLNVTRDKAKELWKEAGKDVELALQTGVANARLDALMARIRGLPQEAQAVVINLESTFNRSNRPPKNRRDGHAGNYWMAGDYGMVGEHGPERIRNIGGVAYVSPTRRGGSSGGPTIVFSGNTFLGTEAEAREMADRIGPHLSRWMARVA